MLLLLAAAAYAADPLADGATPTINAQTFRPAMDSHEFLRVVDSDLAAEGFTGRGVLSYTQDPLQYTNWEGTTETLVGGVMQLDAMAGWTKGRFRLGLDIPVVLRSFGGRDGDATGLGDASIDAKLRLLDPAKSPVGLAMSGRVGMPSASTGGGLGAGGFWGEVTVSGDKHLGDRLDAVVSLGVDFAPEQELENVTWGTRAELQAGLAYSLSARSGVAVELYTAGVLSDFANERARPTELLVGGWTRVGERRGLLVHPGVAFGLNDAVTTPSFRALLSIGWDPLAPKAPPDRDKDGVADGVDTCPDAPEDVDGFADTDGCAERARVTVTVLDTDGMPVPDAVWSIEGTATSGKSGEGVELPAGEQMFVTGEVNLVSTIPGGGAAAVELRVPAPRGGLAVEVVDGKGKPVPGAKWAAKGPIDVPLRDPGTLAVRPGAYELIGRAEGYRPGRASVTVVKDGSVSLKLEMLPAKAALKAEKIEIKDSVYFETGKTVIKPESFALLDEVADILNEHPELTKIKIEGNTDSRGDAKDNLKLSQGRAESVKTYLAGKGVAAARLEAIGYGESKPLVKEKGAADQAKNRRVDFVVAERSDGAVVAPVKLIETPGDKPKEK
ncbi:hypothetical protein LBMAG42_34390 [Deltaproteobacteria bacterium]|nr:hypothetical protein LBMAG42_34390 [Deltaproteobacteria bacterium]